jgi:hypothetical protein
MCIGLATFYSKTYDREVPGVWLGNVIQVFSQPSDKKGSFKVSMYNSVTDPFDILCLRKEWYRASPRVTEVTNNTCVLAYFESLTKINKLPAKLLPQVHIQEIDWVVANQELEEQA